MLGGSSGSPRAALDPARARLQLAVVTRRSVAPAEALRLATREGHVIVDVRTEAEYAEGHPAGAVNVPFLIRTRKGREPNADFLPILDAVFGKRASLILSSQSGERAARAADLVRAAGYELVAELSGGYAAWLADGRPTEIISEGKTYPDMRWQAGLG